MTHQDHIVQAFVRAGVDQRLESDFALVLEKLAYGGGATDWYVCRNPADLAVLASLVRPGSALTFYFDQDRGIEHLTICSSLREVKHCVHRVLAEKRDCLVAVVPERLCRLAINYIDHEDELEAFLAEVPNGAIVFASPSPQSAVLGVGLQVPDEDGVVRRHPH